MVNAKTTVRDLRRLNRQTVLQHAYFAQPISRLELSQVLGLSPATVTNVISELLEEGVLLETGSQESQGGRPRTLLTVNAAHGYFVGIDVGETQTRVELFDLNLKRLGGMSYPIMPEGDQLAQALAHAQQGVAQALAGAGVAREDVLGVGVGVPGVVERASSEMVYVPVGGSNPVPLRDQLREQLQLPVFVDNGAKVMAQAELWFGAGRSVESLAVLLIGTGVGAGMIAEGHLYRGATNSAGEWGHTKIMLDGRPCRCGSRGCLEAYVGAPGIIERFRELAPATELPGNQERALALIVQAHADGLPAATLVIEETARYLGVGLSNLINLVNPEMIVLGGWAGLLLGPLVLPRLRHYAQENSLRQPFTAVRFGMCELGQDAICRGAATLALEQFLVSGGRPAHPQPSIANRPKVPAAVEMRHYHS
ncbi:MAG: ROK family transcriptional regulator [Roseiflexaceae bacterium]